MPELSQDQEEDVPKCSGREISRIFLGKFWFPGNGIREHRPLLEAIGFGWQKISWNSCFCFKGRPLSGVARPGSQGGRPSTMDAALRTPRTSRTARPVSASSGRFVRLGTASMLSQKDGPFINLVKHVLTIFNKLKHNNHTYKQNFRWKMTSCIGVHRGTWISRYFGGVFRGLGALVRG